MHESLQRAQSMVMSLRCDFIQFMTFVQILPLCLSSSHGKHTSAREVKRFPHWGPLKHYLILYWNFKTYKLQTVSQALLLPLTLCAVPPLLLQSTSPGTVFRDEGNLVSAPILPSHLLEHTKTFRLASASTVVISSPITSFLPLLPIQQHHYWKLRLYSSSLKICLHYL